MIEAISLIFSAAIATTLAAFFWYRQKEYEILLSCFETFLLIIPKASQCYTPFGSSQIKEDITFRKKLFSKYSEDYSDRIDNAMARLEIVKGTEEVSDLVKNYFKWKNEFSRKIFLYECLSSDTSGNSKKFIEARDYFWDIDDIQKNKISEIEGGIKKLIKKFMHRRILF